MNDTLTIRGFVGNDPQTSTTSTGISVLNFRVASSRRRFDRETQTWVDAGTNWYAVSAYRQLADHARSSLRKGDAVIVSGRLKFREWENANGSKGASLDLDADAIGHDLLWGTSNFLKSNRPVAATVDIATGEVHAPDPEDELPDDGDQDTDGAGAANPESWLASVSV